uniref:DNA-directed RNA polymerase III subunit rpc1 n=1 Tax=Rhizophora mucronata TaxID=61149 RepID=A0A2P2LRP0_RHIMU
MLHPKSLQRILVCIKILCCTRCLFPVLPSCNST